MARAPAGARRRDPEGSGRRQPVARSSASTAPTDANTGRFLINLKPHDAAQRSTPPTIIRRLQSEAARRRRHHALSAAGAGPDDRLHGQPHAVSVRAGGRQCRRRSRPGCRSCSQRLQQIAANSPTSPAILQQQGLTVESGHRPRHRGALRHHAGDDRQRALRRVRPAHHLDHLHAVEPVSRDPGGRPGAAAVARPGCDRIYLPSSSSATNGQVPLSAIAHVEQQTAPLVINHLGQFPATTISFDTRARRFARRGGRRDQAGGSTRSACRTSFITAFQGAAARLPVVAVQRACC